MIIPVIEAHAFQPHDFVGGHPVLDFVNTVTGWHQSPRDWIDGYERLIEWAQLVQIIDGQTCRKLRNAAKDKPEDARDELARVRETRDLLYQYFSSVAREQNASESMIKGLHSNWLSSLQTRNPVMEDGNLRLEEAPSSISLNSIVDRLNVMAFELAQTVVVDRLRVCDGENCGWLFLDISKAGRRRWCDMKTCGNLAKARRFSAR